MLSMEDQESKRKMMVDKYLAKKQNKTSSKTEVNKEETENTTRKRVRDEEDKVQAISTKIQKVSETEEIAKPKDSEFALDDKNKVFKSLFDDV